MAKTVVLQEQFDRGMIRDLAIDQLPKGAVWDLVDMLPGVKAGLSKRAPWLRHSATVSDTYCAAVAYAPFVAGAQIVAINSAGAVKQVSVTASTVTARGTAQVPYQPPVFYRERVYIPSDNGTTSVKYYDGSNNAAAVSGSPPAGMFTAAWKDHLLLARNAANPNRLWFSNGGDPTAWDTAADGQWLDLTYVPNGLTTLRGMILSFSENAMERVRGDIIPGVAGSDVVKELMFNVGCPDPGAIATGDDYVVFANPNGVFLTDGIGLIDLTQQCGMKTYWRDRMGGTYDTNMQFTGGLYQGHYIVTGMSGTTFIDCLCFDITGRRAWRFSNIKPAMMTSAPTSTNSLSGELLFGERDNPYVSRLSPMWLVHGNGAVNTASLDGNSTSSAPVVKTGYLRGLPGKKRWRRLYITYSMADVGAVGAVTTNASIWTEPSETSQYQQSGYLDETVGTIRKRINSLGSISSLPLSEGVVVQVGSGSALNLGNDFRVYKIEAEVHPLEQSR